MGELPLIHIKAPKFPVLPGEDLELYNEGTYGKALAQYLQEHLKNQYSVPSVGCEDWGWWVEVEGQPFTMGVCVYATKNLPTTHELCVAISPQPGRRWSWSRFRFVDSTPIVTKLFEDVVAIFKADPEVEVLGYPEAYPLE